MTAPVSPVELNSMAKTITNDDLAAMIQGGFEEAKTDRAAIREDVEHIGQQISKSNERLDRIDKRLDQIERRLDHIETVVLDDHLQRIRAVEHAIGLRKTA